MLSPRARGLALLAVTAVLLGTNVAGARGPRGKGSEPDDGQQPTEAVGSQIDPAELSERCDGPYPKAVRLVVGEELRWERDRKGFERMPEAERFEVNGRYGGQILFPAIKLLDLGQKSVGIQVHACDGGIVALSADELRAEPVRYFLWARMHHNGFVKLMDFGSSLSDSVRKPAPEGEPVRWYRIAEGVSGNPEKIRNIYEVRVKLSPGTAE